MNQYCKVMLRGEIVDDIGRDENGHYFALVKVDRASDKFFRLNFGLNICEKMLAGLKSGDIVLCEGTLRHSSYGPSLSGGFLTIVISKIEKDG